MPPMPPDYGYGPVNYANQGGNDPFGAFDNRIRYNDMVRHQMVSQYQQEVVRPSTMTLSQARQVATERRFQYGVPGGQDPRFYERQAELSRMAYGSSLSKGMLDIGMYGLAEAGLTAAGVGTIGAFTLPIAATLAPMHFINKGVQNSLERRKFVHGIAADVEQYRDRLGFKGGLSYSQATRLGTSLQESMYEPGQFFSKSQQMDIHKIGLSNNLINAAGKGMSSGTISQYKKNFEELRDTTEEVVKLLQTTVEGGMSVIKELQQKGFGNIRQIRQQVVQAKALGGMTGLGAQNMMQIGAAGAQAVQGTPWSANVGASMYQIGAAEAATMVSSGAAGAYAVKRVGGVAAAGATIGNFAMNMMQSGIGTKLAAYAMKGDGSVDEDRLQRVLSGKASGYEIVTGANRVGYAMGENRVRFGMFKEDLLNQMSDKERTQMVTAGFNAWSKQRPYSSLENKAYVFAGLYTNDPRSQRLMYQNLMTAKDYGTMRARTSVERAMLDERRGAPIGMRKLFKGTSDAFNQVVNDVGESITQASSDVMNAATDVWGGLKTGVGMAGEGILKGVGIVGPEGFIDRTNYADMRSSYENLYGLRGATNVQAAALNRATEQDLAGLNVQSSSIGFDAKSIVNKWKRAGNYQYAIQRMGVAAGSGDWAQLANDPRFLGGFGADQIAGIKKNPQAAMVEMTGILSKHEESISGRYEKAVGVVNTSERIKNRDTEQQKRDRLFIERTTSQIKAGNKLILDPELKAGSVRTKKEVYDVIMKPGIYGTKVAVPGKVTQEGGIAYGTRGISPEIVDMQRALEEKAGLGPVSKELLGNIGAAAGVRADVDYASIMGIERELVDKSMYGVQFQTVGGYKAGAKKLMKAVGNRFNLRKKKGRDEFAVSLLGAQTSAAPEDVQLLADVTGAIGQERVDAITKMAATQEAGKAMIQSTARANMFLQDVDVSKLSVDRANQVRTLVTKAYRGKLTDTGFDTLRNNYQKLVSGGISGAEDLIKEGWKSKEAFMGLLNNKAIDKEKDAPKSTLELMKEELTKLRMVASGETKETIRVRTFDGKGGEESIEEAGWFGRGEGVRKGKASRLVKELEQKIEDEEKYKAQPQTKTMNAVVRPPVLNYWNNRWVL